MPPRLLRPVIWMGDSLRVLKEFPAGVQDEVGYALYVAQAGGSTYLRSPLKGLGSGVLEVMSDHERFRRRLIRWWAVDSAQETLLHAARRH